MDDFAIEWVRGSDTATVTAPSSTRFKSKLLKLSTDYPEDVKIITINEDGSILAEVPVKYVTIRRPRRVSESQREAARERLKARHAAEKEKKNG